MPTTSVDTFFACVLMVIVVLSAMAATSNISSVIVNSNGEGSSGISQLPTLLLLREGRPSDWGREKGSIPEVFGLADPRSYGTYDLDIDKVTRCNPQNIFSLTYAEAYAALDMPDVSFELEIKPLFDVGILQTAEYAQVNETIFQFRISTEKAGLPIQTNIKVYMFANDRFDSYNLATTNAEAWLNVSLPATYSGSALMAVIASSVADSRIVSFASLPFASSSVQTEPDSQRLKLSPLNQAFTVSTIGTNVTVSQVFALSYSHNSTLTLVDLGNGTWLSSLPDLVDSSPMLIVALGNDGASLFSEWTSYPQIPVRFGSDFSAASAGSSVFASEYVVTIGSVIYSCVVRVSEVG